MVRHLRIGLLLLRLGERRLRSKERLKWNDIRCDVRRWSWRDLEKRRRMKRLLLLACSSSGHL